MGGDDKYPSCPCDVPKYRRLYIRGGPHGNQKFVKWGIVCVRCGSVFSKRPTRATQTENNEK